MPILIRLCRFGEVINFVSVALRCQVFHVFMLACFSYLPCITYVRVFRRLFGLTFVSGVVPAAIVAWFVFLRAKAIFWSKPCPKTRDPFFEMTEA